MKETLKNIKNDIKAKETITSVELNDLIAKYSLNEKDCKDLKKILKDNSIEVINDIDSLDNIDENSIDLNDVKEVTEEELKEVENININEVLNSNRSSLGLYLNEVKKHRLLTFEEERDLGRKYKNGDLNARKKLIESNLRLVISLAKGFAEKGYDLLELIQDGNIGLMKAVDRFNPELGYKFSTYATWWIRQALRQSVNDNTGVIRLPIHTNELIGRIINFEQDYSDTHMGEMPSIEKVAKFALTDRQNYHEKARSMTRQQINNFLLRNNSKPLSEKDNLSEDELAKLLYNTQLKADIYKVIELKRKAYELDAASLDSPIGEEEDTLLIEMVKDDSYNEDTAMSNLIRKDIIRIIENSSLDDREKDVIYRRNGFVDERVQTLEEIAKDYGVTRERIRQIESKSYRKLRSKANRDKFKTLRY